MVSEIRQSIFNLHALERSIDDLLARCEQVKQQRDAVIAENSDLKNKIVNLENLIEEGKKQIEELLNKIESNKSTE